MCQVQDNTARVAGRFRARPRDQRPWPPHLVPRLHRTDGDASDGSSGRRGCHRQRFDPTIFGRSTMMYYAVNSVLYFTYKMDYPAWVCSMVFRVRVLIPFIFVLSVKMAISWISYNIINEYAITPTPPMLTIYAQHRLNLSLIITQI